MCVGCASPHSRNYNPCFPLGIPVKIYSTQDQAVAFMDNVSLSLQEEDVHSSTDRQSGRCVWGCRVERKINTTSPSYMYQGLYLTLFKHAYFLHEVISLQPSCFILIFPRLTHNNYSYIHPLRYIRELTWLLHTKPWSSISGSYEERELCSHGRKHAAPQLTQQTSLPCPAEACGAKLSLVFAVMFVLLSEYCKQTV